MIKDKIRQYLFKDTVSETEYLMLKTENQHLKLNLQTLQDQLKKERLFRHASHQDVPIAGFDDLTIEPESEKDRMEFIGRVTTFFDDIFHRKLKVGIAEVRELLSNIGRQEGTPLSMSRVEYDAFLRGMEAAFWKMSDWAYGLDAERKQNLQDKENNN